MTGRPHAPTQPVVRTGMEAVGAPGPLWLLSEPGSGGNRVHSTSDPGAQPFRPA